MANSLSAAVAQTNIRLLQGPERNLLNRVLIVGIELVEDLKTKVPLIAPWASVVVASHRG